MPDTFSDTLPKRRRVAAACGTVIALAAAAPGAHAASVRTITDVWGGSGNGNIAQGCTTYGPVPDLLAFFGEGGLRVLGGNIACGYAGGSDDQTQPAGPLLSHQVLGSTALDGAGSSYQGSASARATFGSLGVAAHGVLSGTPNGTSARNAAAAAFFHDTLSATSPHIAPSAPGFVRYVFEMDGSLLTGTPFGTASVQLGLRQSAGPVVTLGRLSVLPNAPAQFSAIDASSAGWTLGSGSLSGAGSFGSTVHVPFFGDIDLPMVWGDPWDVEVGLMALSALTADADFLSTAKLVDIQLFDAAHERVTDFTLSAASGTDYLGAAPPPVGVPEPPAWALAGLALLALAARRAGSA